MPGYKVSDGVELHRTMYDCFEAVKLERDDLARRLAEIRP